MSRFKPDPLVAEAFRELYTPILHFLRKRTDNASDAADMTQDVFTQWLGYQDRAKVEQPRAQPAARPLAPPTGAPLRTQRAHRE